MEVVRIWNGHTRPAYRDVKKITNVGFNNGKGNSVKGSTPDTLDGGQFLHPWS